MSRGVRGAAAGSLLSALACSSTAPTAAPATPEARAYIGNAVARRKQAGDERVQVFELAPTNPADGYGCDWHPSLRTHEVMAGTLTATLRAALGW